MAHCFTIKVSDEIATVLKNVESTLTSSGGSLDGGTDCGSFSGCTPIGRIRGEYLCLSPVEIKVTIIDKPFLLTYGVIESEIRKYFGALALSCFAEKPFLKVLCMPDEKSKLVYSTDKPISPKEGGAQKIVKPELTPAPQKSSSGRNVIVRLDRKGRGGKSVTVIDGLRITAKEREKLLRELKARLGTGGTVKDTSLEIKGDHREAIISELKTMGYSPKRSGG